MITIASVTTPPDRGENTAQAGDFINVEFTTRDDSADGTFVRVYATTLASGDTAAAINIPIFGGSSTFGPGVSSGAAVWDTTGVTPGSYHIFAQADDLVNAPVLTTYPNQVTIIPIPPEGLEALNSPPQLAFLNPLPNLGLAANDEVVIRYIYADPDNDVTLTLLLDTDLDPTNDDISNPGDPQDPGTKIFILPSAVRLPTDPTFDGDPLPPDDPNNPPIQPDSVQIRQNPRTFTSTVAGLFPFAGAPLAGELKEYRFIIDLAQIPVRSEPYFIRATISDGIAPQVHSYAVGSLAISSLASGDVDIGDIGGALAGARFQGFSEGENLGVDFVAASDLDLDGPQEFMIASRFASPGNRNRPGAAYLVYGRRKTPFPSDDNNNGLPDVLGPDGTLVDFPEPPEYLPNPYDAANVGRFGGIVSINSVISFFRGTVYTMPEPHGYTPPQDELFEDYYPASEHPGILTAGLMSITRIDMTQDGVPDLVFGLPYVSAAWEHHDDDPADGCGDSYRWFDWDYRYYPNYDRCTQPPNDDMISERNPPPPAGVFDNEVNQGIVIMVDGTNDISTIFNRSLDAGLAGQHDPVGAIDDEGVWRSGAMIPLGMRFRGGWWDRNFPLPEGEEISNCCSAHDHDEENPTGCDDSSCEALVCARLGFEYCCGEGEEEGGWNADCADLATFLCEGTCVDEFVYESRNEFGRTVARLPDFDNMLGDELLISVPGDDPMGGFLVDGSMAPWDPDDFNRGAIQVWLSHFYTDDDWYSDTVMSLPNYTQCDNNCSDGEPGVCFRCMVGLPSHIVVLGEEPGDLFGYATAAGDFNQDGTEDILAGAPGADRSGLTDCGIVYVLALNVAPLGNTDMSRNPLEHLKVIGSHEGDRFGKVQDSVRDINGDGIADIAFAAEYYDDATVGQDAGYVGVIFGNRPITGELSFSPEDVATPSLPGVKFIGSAPGAYAGRDIASAGDFNGDGDGDLLISCPGETKTVGGQTRLGVAYLIFGGHHLYNKTFNLDQVGSSALPGIVFTSRFVQGSIDEAPLETVGGLGDIDGDGFDDIAIGAPRADFVNIASPDQRRPDAGEVYVVYGSNFGSNFIDD